ncbi:MAG: cell division protein FtsA [Azospirillum sp.]|jgi:cell division protein FtsA|nr:cell division protein FtsA [Azospirillum sp.]MCZ8122779.1 cell division protein FtsA [Magnetospirillum sp.]
MSKKKRARRNGTIAALDLGSTKVACFVAKAEADGQLRVTGIGHQISRGVRGGTIVDLDEAEHSILSAVSAAETMAGETLKSVVVNLVGGAPLSRTYGVEVALNGHEIGDSDLRRAIEQARQTQATADRRVVHQIPVGFTIDGSRGIRDPRGMCGERLGVNMHMVSAANGAIRNLETAVARCHLELEEPVVPAYASGLACLVEDEMDLGACVIDMGGGTTSFAVFFDGHCVFVDQIGVGGAHVTNDIARGLSTPLAHAERIKTLHGSCIGSASDERELVDVPLVGEEEQTQANHVPKSILTGIVAPRIEETFELVRSRLEASGFDKIAGRRVVLTGGASQLQGVRELAAMILDKQVRMGKPTGLLGLADQTGGPAFAACAGLVFHAHRNGVESLRPETAAPQAQGMFGRFGMWLRENL